MAVKLEPRRKKKPEWSCRLVHFRGMTGLKPIEFARALGISQQRYSNYERGIREPDIAMWNQIREKFNLPIYFIITGECPVPWAEKFPGIAGSLLVEEGSLLAQPAVETIEREPSDVEVLNESLPQKAKNSHSPKSKKIRNMARA